MTDHEELRLTYLASRTTPAVRHPDDKDLVAKKLAKYTEDGETLITDAGRKAIEK